jgi:two-component system sensor histidine kinase/response regulator
MNSPEVTRLEDENFWSARRAIYRHTDALFAGLMLIQWALGVATALWLSPWTWKGNVASLHPHVWASVFLGGLFVSLPVFFAWRFPGRALTRHSFAVAQMLYGGLLIHLTGGRIETHFHIFGSLAFLAFYRDGWVLLTASLVVMLDHFLRGIFWPESIYGAIAAPLWRSFEHMAWVVFEDGFLIVAIRRSLTEMRRVARREAELEILNAKIETKVRERTKQLAASEERFGQLADNSPDVFWFLDLDPERMRYVSPSVEQLWGIPQQSLYREPRQWEQCIHPDDRMMVIQALADAVAAPVPTLECDYRIFRPDKGVRWVQFRGTIIRDETGKAIRLGGLSRDVTEQKLAEEKIRLEAQRLRMAAAASGVGVWEFHPETGEPEWDDQMYRLYGVSKDSPEPRKVLWEKCVHPDDLPRAREAFKRSLKNAIPLAVEFRIFRKNDRALRHIRGMASIFRSENEETFRLVGANWDVTEERLREAELRDALERQTQLTEQALAGERAKREFLASMSHEIRTPLGGMLGFAEATLEMDGLPPGAAEFLRMIKDGGEALMRIIDDILDFSRMGAGQLRIEKAPFSPTELLEDVRALFSHQAQTKDLMLTVEMDGQIPSDVLGDAGRIRQILLNLVGNAMKFTATGGVKIKAGVVRDPSDSPRMEFAVEDTGPGVPPDLLPTIFQPFTQADFSNARKHGGVGLGLAISSTLAELMGGTMSAGNTASGARFVLSLPLEAAETRTETKEIAPSRDIRPLPGGKILIVEDDKINRALLLSMLRNTGYEVAVAMNGQEAISLFTRMRPDCVIMDVQMPVMDGIEAARKLRQIEQAEDRTPSYIVALTADIMPENRENCLAAGMDGYLNKPVKKAELAAVLEAAGQLRQDRSVTQR